MGLFEPKNKIRQLCFRIVNFKYYDNVILGLIGISTILLTLDNPLYDQDGLVMTVFLYLDILMTSIFTLECVINIILFGFLINGKRSYIRDSWNQLDFTIVVLTIFSYTAATDSDFGFLKIFRMLRVLRPLMFLKRNPGLRI